MHKISSAISKSKFVSVAFAQVGGAVAGNSASLACTRSVLHRCTRSMLHRCTRSVLHRCTPRPDEKTVIVFTPRDSLRRPPSKLVDFSTDTASNVISF